MGWPQCGATQIYLATQPMGLFPFQDSISLIRREDGEKQCPLSLVPSPIQAYHRHLLLSPLLPYDLFLLSPCWVL